MRCYCRGGAKPDSSLSLLPVHWVARMLRNILLTALMVLLPYVIYGIVGLVRRRLEARIISPAETGFWRGAPVLLLGLVGCLLAVAMLIMVAVVENDPDQPAYQPPVNAGQTE